MDRNQIERNLTFHAADEETREKIRGIFDAAKVFADAIAVAPEGRCKSLAQTKLEESVMWANKALAVPGA